MTLVGYWKEDSGCRVPVRSGILVWDHMCRTTERNMVILGTKVVFVLLKLFIISFTL